MHTLYYNAYSTALVTRLVNQFILLLKIEHLSGFQPSPTCYV